MQRHRPMIRGIFASCLALLLLAAAGTAGRPETSKEGSPASSSPAHVKGLIEKTEVSLILLDVEVPDSDGQPVRGLTKEDFRVKLNGRERSLYSVDEMCSRGAGVPPELAEAHESLDPLRFILYLDFSQLRSALHLREFHGTDGREHALAESRRWLEESFQPGDQAMIAAYATKTGLRVLSPFTEDRSRLLGALAEAEQSPDFVDEFPCEISNRQWECCRFGRGVCKTNALLEYAHGRRSLTALKAFLTGLAAVPGRKALIYFHQNQFLFPSRIYAISESEIGDHVRLAEEVAAEANRVRAVVFPVYVGSDTDWERVDSALAYNFGANMADFTGGRHNKSPQTLSAVTSAAGRTTRCFYRLAIRLSAVEKTRLYRTVVEVRGRTLEPRYRVQVLSEQERWLRQSLSVMANPELAADLPVAAALLPEPAGEERWNLSVLISLELDSLLTLPEARDITQWEVGAILLQDEGRRSWQMLGLSDAHNRAEGPMAGTVVHEGLLRDLKPGRYRLSAFVRDRAANLYGGAEAELVLPERGEDGLVGVVLVRPDTRRYLTGLPRFSTNPVPSRVTTRADRGTAPVGSRPIGRDESIEALSWLCPKDPGTAPGSLLRVVLQGGTPVDRSQESALSPAGRCFLARDRVDISPLEPGAYVLKVVWKRSGARAEAASTEGGEASSEDLTAESSFTVAAPRD